MSTATPNIRAVRNSLQPTCKKVLHIWHIETDQESLRVFPQMS